MSQTTFGQIKILRNSFHLDPSCHTFMGSSSLMAGKVLKIHSQGRGKSRTAHFSSKPRSHWITLWNCTGKPLLLHSASTYFLQTLQKHRWGMSQLLSTSGRSFKTVFFFRQMNFSFFHRILPTCSLNKCPSSEFQVAPESQWNRSAFQPFIYLNADKYTFAKFFLS